MTKNFLWNNENIHYATKCETLGGVWKGSHICIDSRKLIEDSIFVAIKGRNADGHDFVSKAIDNGAAAAIVSHIPSNISKKYQDRLILVKDTIKTINDLALFNRKQTKAKIIGVTGSVGKTSTKEALKFALSERYKTYCNPGNYNNDLGLPISLASMPLDTEFGIFELGMNHAGEIEHLTKILKPDLAIITNISSVHLENFNSIQDIAYAKAEIFLGLSKNSYVLLNGDDRFYGLLKEEARKQNISNIFSFGLKKSNDCFMIKQKRVGKSTLIDASIFSKHISYDISAYGDHQVLNSIIALSAADILQVNITHASKGLKYFDNLRGRGKIYNISHDNKKIMLVDDSYNASPKSMESSFKALRYIAPCKGRKIAILADMYELGSTQVQMHQALLPHIQDSIIDKVITVGDLMQSLHEILPPNLKLVHFKNYHEVIEAIDDIIQEYDCILVKGSYGTKIYELINYLEHAK